MKSNRLFYIGIGCLISTLCWTIFVIAKEETNLSKLEVDRIVCKELHVLDKDGKVGILIYDRPYGDGGGSDLIISVKDNTIFSDGRMSKGEVTINSSRLAIYNSMGLDVVSVHEEVDNGSLSLRKRDDTNLFYIDTENAKYSKTHCPCQFVE